MRRTLAAALAAIALTGTLAPTADAYTSGAAPVLLDFSCNADGTVTYVWDKTAGKPAEVVLRRVFPTPESATAFRVPGSRGSKGDYTFTTSYSTQTNQLQGQLRTRGGVYSNTLSSTCP